MWSEEIPYDVAGEQPPEERRAAWDVAFGLQAVDGLTPSSYMRTLADDHVAGRRTYDEIDRTLRTYYREISGDPQARPAEADIVSLRIAELLADDSFTLSVATVKTIHRFLFAGVFTDVPAGEFRSVNITKKEPILGGDTVSYSSYFMIADTLDYDFGKEKSFDYRPLDTTGKARHLMEFISGIWQIHPFREGNTRTTAVFAIKYARTLGFAIDNVPFRDHSQYFRDALVADNYHKNRHPEFLRLFTDAVFLGGTAPLDVAAMAATMSETLPHSQG